MNFVVLFKLVPNSVLNFSKIVQDPVKILKIALQRAYKNPTFS